MEENNLTEKQVEAKLQYLADILFESFMNRKGYESQEWLNGEKKWIKNNN